MKKIAMYTVLLMIGFSLAAQQEYHSVLTEIEANNASLQVLRRQMDAQKLQNKTENNLEDPEVEFGYLWGSPSSIGNRTDFSVSQSFDFPTVYTQRRKVIQLENNNLDYQYASERINILLSAKKICVDMVYYNALIELFANRLSTAKNIAENYRKKIESGDANILEVNKAELNLASLQAEYDKAVSERDALSVSLVKMNGGKAITFTQGRYNIQLLPVDFEAWYTQMEVQNPMLKHAENQVLADRQRVKLNQNQWLPKLSAGYMNETVVGESYQGLKVGISLPLWNNRNKVKQSKAQVTASGIALENTKIEFYNELKMLYKQSVTLQQNAEKLNKTLDQYNSEALLEKALNAGEISLLEYLIEIEFYQDARIKALEAQRNAETAIAELYIVEL